MSYSLAIDIGGTFTDAVLRGSNGTLVVDKTLTTHENLLEGFFRGVDLVLGKAGIGPEAVDGVVVHATTVVTNALIERKGRPTALITTKGFRDLLPIRNEHRYDMYDPQIEFAEPLGVEGRGQGAGGRPALDHAHGMAAGDLGADDAAAAEHDQRPVRDSRLFQASGQAAQIRLGDRGGIGVDRGRGGPRILADLRRDTGRQ